MAKISDINASDLTQPAKKDDVAEAILKKNEVLCADLRSTNLTQVLRP
jgi:hypothetical protein